MLEIVKNKKDILGIDLTGKKTMISIIIRKSWSNDACIGILGGYCFYLKSVQKILRIPCIAPLKRSLQVNSRKTKITASKNI